MQINFSPHFKRTYQRLAPELQADFDVKITRFVTNPRDPRLRVHKLKGKLEECLAFSLRDGYRVLFEYAEADTVNLLDIGPHDLYQCRQ